MYSLKNKQKDKKQLSKNTIVLLLCGLATIVGLAVLADAKNIIDIPLFPDKKIAEITGTINYNPPTKEEVTETQDFKDNLSSDKPTNSAQDSAPQSNGKRAVAPVISSWGYENSVLQASGFVPGLIESGGTCTLNAVKDGVTVSAKIDSTQNAQNVSCGLIKINREKLSPGTWKLTLSYNSAGYEGSSTPQTQEVQQ